MTSTLHDACSGAVAPHRCNVVPNESASSDLSRHVPVRVIQRNVACASIPYLWQTQDAFFAGAGVHCCVRNSRRSCLCSYPLWFTSRPIHFPPDIAVEYKYIIIAEGRLAVR